MAGGSVKLFQFIQKCHQIFGIYPGQSNQKHRSTNWTKAIFLISFGQISFTTITFFMFESKSLFDYGFAFYTLISTIGSIAFYLIFLWQLENTLEFIENCERFIKMRAHSTIAYIELIGNIELFNRILCYGLNASILLFLIMVVPFCYVRYFIFQMDEHSFYLLAPAWFPFNWKTPIGYLMAWMAQCTGCIAIVCTIGHFLNIVIGSCWLFIAIVEDITGDVVAFNIATKTTTSTGNRTALIKQFSDLIQIYSDAKRCVMKFNQTFKYSLFTLFSWNMLGVSTLLITVQFELWADDSNLFEIILLTFALIWNILFILLLFEPGARLIIQLDKFNDELNRCDWYLLPIELQQWYVIFISNTQTPIKVMSYANIACERDTSKEMINKIFSYFMTFRRFKP